MEQAPLQPTPVGAFRFNTDSSKMEYYDGNQWVNVTSTSPEVHTGGARGLFYAGGTPSIDNVIQYVNISTVGDAVDFGDANVASNSHAGFSSRTRGFKAGGNPSSNNTIEFVTFASTGNGTDFGDLTGNKTHACGVSNSTRGVIGPGEFPSTARSNVIEYVTMSHSGNSIDFGDSTVGNQIGQNSGLGSPIRGIFVGGSSPSSPAINSIDYITIATTGNAADFGDLLSAQERHGCCSNAVRGIIGSGAPSATNTIQYLTIATLGNTIDFGDSLYASNYGKAGMSSPTRGVFGSSYGPTTDSIEYVQIMTTGDAVDFGNLLANRRRATGCSNSHGGLG